ncbi:MAG: glycosyltransferase [Candidatus Dependentiae bacterium]|nr:glycosyltransferase [Candidatus Dependentiae bacterium]
MKKIIIFTSTGGGGHTAVSNALKKYLDDTYTIEINDVFNDVLGPLDLTNYLTGGRLTYVGIYNYYTAKKWYRFLNFMFKPAAWFFNTIARTKIHTLLKNYFTQTKPDLIISVAPLVNSFILDVAQQKNIPFLLVPTDLDLDTFIINIKKPTYKKFKIALPFDDAQEKNELAQAKIPSSMYDITGFVVGPEFFEPKDKDAIKNQYKITKDKPVILVILGSLGSQALYEFAQQLAQLSFPAHLILCLGKEALSKEAVQSITFPKYITVSMIAFTDRVSDLMAIADLLITKSGSVSVNEAIYMNLPMILDATSSILTWEAYNHDFIKKHGFGTNITDFTQLTQLVTYILMPPATQLGLYKNNLVIFEKKHGGDEIKKLIKAII